MDTEHDLTLLFKIGEHFIDNDGYEICPIPCRKHHSISSS